MPFYGIALLLAMGMMPRPLCTPSHMYSYCEKSGISWQEWQDWLAQNSNTTWKVEGCPGATITSTGLFTASTTGATCIVKGESVENAPKTPKKKKSP